MNKEYFLFQGRCENALDDRVILLTGNFRYVFYIKEDDHKNLKAVKKIKADDIVTVRAYTENRYGSYQKHYLDKISSIKRKNKVLVSCKKGRPSRC